VVDKSTFQFAIMSIRSGDIRDQSRKLSEIAPILDVFSPSQMLGQGARAF